MEYSLKELRKRKGKTAQEIADAIGVSPATYCLWEKHISNVSVSKVAALCRYFGITLDEIKYQHLK